MNIGKSIKNIRLSNNIARSDLAEKVNISTSYLGQIENGVLPRIPVLQKIADCFKIPLAVLFWLAIEENDIDKSKIDIYKLFKVPINSMMENLTKTDQQTLEF